MDVRLDGRTALITGASEGLGLAMAHRFAESGANVAMLARRKEVLEAARSEVAQAVAGTQVRVEAVPCDVTDTAQIAAAWEQVSGSLGGVDILVNNAGAHAVGSVLETSDEVWQADFDLKFFGAIRFSRLAMPGMMERNWGRILNVLAVSAKTPGAGSVPTSVSRAAGMALTKVMSAEGAPHNVLVNALLVGLIESGQHRRRHARNAPDTDYADYMAERGKAIPIGRVGEAMEFANMACFLASDMGSYVTGCAINVDGGRSPVM